ncbi:hypothetical protein HK096_009447 [Nowakowskiella sp. JEL0078]|nr:hypothetical protein HK096_009447 [Nowakowskiella sp. JEL0078]
MCSIVLILKKESGEPKFFRLRTAFLSNFAAFREKVFLKIKEYLPPGYTFTLKYKSKVENQTYELRDDEDFETVLSEPSSFEILAYPKASEHPIYDILLTIFKAPKTQIDVSYLKDAETINTKVNLSQNQTCDYTHFIAAIEDSLGFEVSDVSYVNSATNEKSRLNYSSLINNFIHLHYKFVVEIAKPPDSQYNSVFSFQ